MIINYLYAALVMAALIRPSVAAFVYVAGIILFDVTCGNLDGAIYFPLGALFDLAVILIIFITKPDGKAIVLAKISIISAVFNLVGLVFWWLYLPSDLYVSLFYALYAAAFVALLKKDYPDGNILGTFTLPLFGRSYHTGFNTRHHLYKPDGDEI